MLQTILIAISLAAPGDVVFVSEGNTVVLTSPQKLELASALASAEFADVKPASLDKFHCWANIPQPENKRAINLEELADDIVWTCRAVDASPTVTDEQVIEMELEDGDCKIVDKGSSSFLVCARPQMSEDGETLLGAFTQSVFAKTLLRTYSFVCERNPEDADEISCQPHTIEIKTPALWRADRKSEIKKVKGVIGRVAAP